MAAEKRNDDDQPEPGQHRSDDSPVLYLLMRTDMKSMNPGKAMAQAHHAGTDFMMNGRVTGTEEGDALLEEWMGPGTFGYVYVLSAVEKDLKGIEACISGNEIDKYYGQVCDRTYPIRDGEVTHYLPTITCAWLFGRKKDVAPLVEGLKLHK